MQSPPRVTRQIAKRARKDTDSAQRDQRTRKQPGMQTRVSSLRQPSQEGIKHVSPWLNIVIDDFEVLYPSSPPVEDSIQVAAARFTQPICISSPLIEATPEPESEPEPEPESEPESEPEPEKIPPVWLVLKFKLNGKMLGQNNKERYIDLNKSFTSFQHEFRRLCTEKLRHTAMQTLADFEVSYQYDYIPSSKKQHKSGTIIYSDLEDASDWQTLQTVVRNTRESKRVDMLIYLIANIKIERENVDGDEVQNKDITDDEAVEDEGPRVRSYLYWY